MNISLSPLSNIGDVEKWAATSTNNSVAATPSAVSNAANGVTDVDRASLESALTELMRAAGSTQTTSGSSALNSAMEKIKSTAELLCSINAGGLTSEAMQLFFEKSQQSNEQIASSKDNIRDHFSELQQKTEQKIEQIKKQMEAKKKSGFFSSLMNVFKAVATVLAAASSVFTGGLGIAAAAMMIASFVVSQCDLGDAGKWISLGLGLGAGGMGIANAVMTATSSAVSLAEKVGKLATQIGSATAEGASSATGIAQACADSDAMNAAANLQEIKTAAQKLLQQEETERETIRELYQAMHEGFMRIVGIVGAEHSKNMVATQPNIG